MSWLYSQALVAEFSRANCSATEPSAPSSVTEVPQAFSCDAKTMATFNHSRSGMTCAPLTADRGEALLTWYLGASHARTSALPVAEMALTGRAADSGAKWRAWFAKLNPGKCEWKTPQCSLLGGSELFSGIWPRSGSMLDGTCYPQPTLAPSICVSASGSLLPTLTVCGNYNAKGASKTSWDGLATALARLPTLTARDYRSEKRSEEGFAKRAAERRGHTLPATLDHDSGGKSGPLNPDWCEWFMGFPIGWTASERLETHKFRAWRQQHGPRS